MTPKERIEMAERAIDRAGEASRTSLAMLKHTKACAKCHKIWEDTAEFVDALYKATQANAKCAEFLIDDAAETAARAAHMTSLAAHYLVWPQSEKE